MKNPFKPRKSPTQARAQETVDTILKAAAHILTEGEGHEITTNQIAEKAGVSIGSLYQYFPKKESILAALIETYMERRLRQIEEKMSALSEANDGTFEEAIDQTIDTLIELKVKNLKLERALLNHFSRWGDFEVVKRLDERSVEVITKILLNHQSEIRPVNSEWTAFILLQTIRGILFAVLTHRPQKLRDPALREELRKLVRSYLIGGESKGN